MIDFNQYSSDLIAAILRKPRMKALLQVCVSKVVEQYNTFTTEKARLRKEAGYTVQTGLFESALNDLFDNAQRRITIDNTWDNITLPTIYRVQDNANPVTVYRLSDAGTALTLYRQQDLLQSYDFIVNVPVEYEATQDAAIRAAVKRIKKAGKRAKINYI